MPCKLVTCSKGTASQWPYLSGCKCAATETWSVNVDDALHEPTALSSPPRRSPVSRPLACPVSPGSPGFQGWERDGAARMFHVSKAAQRRQGVPADDRQPGLVREPTIYF